MKDFGYIETPLSEFGIFHTPLRVPLPESYTLRELLGPIRNQGDTPKCVSVAVTDALMVYAKRRNFPLFEMDDALIWSERKNKYIRGMSAKEGLSLAKKLHPVKINTFARVNPVVDEIKANIVLDGPVLCALPVRSMGTRFWDGNSYFGGHMALLVGYDHTHFFIRNSWGDEWGDYGYSYIGFDEINQFLELWCIVC